MNCVLAKIKSRDVLYEKLYMGKPIYSSEIDLTEVVEYNPETILDENEWFVLRNLSSTDYCISLLKEAFRSTDYPEANKVRTEKIEYIVSYQEGKYMFQRILKNTVMKKRLLTLGDNIHLVNEEKSILVNELPDAIFVKKDDALYFKKLSLIAAIFDGIDELYREATKEETKIFLESDFIKTVDGYGVDSVKKNNRKRIAMAQETLSGLKKTEKIKILEYTHKYYPDLDFDERKHVFTISNEEQMKYLLYGIEQRYYTTPITHEKRIANSVMKLE